MNRLRSKRPGQALVVCPNRSSLAARHLARKAALALLLASPLSLAACGGDQEETQQGQTASGAAVQGTETLEKLNVNSGDEVHTGLFDEFDPRTQGWDSEVFQDLASGQLKRVAAFFAGHAEDDPGLESLLGAGFTCPELVPAELTLMHEDQALLIQRMDAAASESERRFNGADGFLEAAKPIIATLQSDPEPHAKFKIFNVELGEMTSRTNTLLETWGPGGVHYNATWRCTWTNMGPEVAPLLESIEVLSFQVTTRKDANTPLFVDVTESVLGGNSNFASTLQTGVNYWRSRLDASVRGMTMLGHLGLALGDINGDGLDDLFLSQIGGLPNQLFLQNADGTLTDVTESSGVDYLNNTHGALFLDLDNDGDQDLVFPVETLTQEAIVFLENDGTGKFTEAAQLHGGEDSYSLAAADYDQDGDIDIYFCRYARIERGIPDPYHDANNGPPNILLRNDGDWKFTDVVPGSGLDQNNNRFSFAAAWEDYDNDGDLDLYVANDFGRNNLFRNDGNDFVDVAAEAGVEDISAGMGITWGDYDGDGWVDIYVSNMYSNAGNRVTYQRRFEDSKDSELLAIQRHAKGNTLFRNMGDGTFEDVSFECGVNMGRWAWSSRFADVDNNGLDDLLTVNGFVTNESSDDL
ncbi:MAG: hypothetical protein ACI8QS_001144 [Planctomycetota bacterium]|jgi:hypothetical protein